MKQHARKFSVLLIDDDRPFLKTMKKLLCEETYHIQTASNAEEALDIFSNSIINFSLIDLYLPGMNGLELLREIRCKYPECMSIMLTGVGGVADSVKAIKSGAIDFLQKPVEQETIRQKVKQLYKIWSLQEEIKTIKAGAPGGFTYPDLLGNTDSMIKIKEMIVQIASTKANILIEGETGTGKELVARAIHHHSPRSKNVFMPVDCATISKTVVESELFGHVKGAFSGAHISTQGLIRSAHKGTLFLDEISKLPIDIQGKLLRSLQEREVRPVGSNKWYPVDVRILAASNRNLSEIVQSGSFSESLFYRLNVISLTIPPLRDRKEDIPLLARHFMKKYTRPGSGPINGDDDVFHILTNYNWPGNVRELENTIQRCIYVCQGNTIRPSDLPERLNATLLLNMSGYHTEQDASLESYERAAISNALLQSKNNKQQAARILNIGKTTLYRKMKKYNVHF